MQLPAWVIDAAERAIKTFSQAFIAAAGVGSGLTDFSGIPWVHAAQIGVVAVVLSLLTSAASINFGNSGTASLTEAVEPVQPRAAKKTRTRKT